MNTTQPSRQDPFWTLGFYGRVLRFLGGLLIAVGLIVTLVLIVFVQDLRTSLAVFVATLVQGILLIVAGEAIQCFIAIERNTRKTAELLAADRRS